jgi:hypothetical protein
MYGLRGIFRFLLVLLSVTAILSCETAKTIQQGATRPFKRMASSFGGDDSPYTKLVAFWGIKNNTPIQRRDIMDMFQVPMLESFNKHCDKAKIIMPQDRRFPEDLLTTQRLESGELDNFTLSQIGSYHGINTLVITELISLSFDDERKGFLWFRRKHFYVNLQVRIQVFDTSTATKLVDDQFIHDTEVDEAEFQAIKSPRLEDVSFMVEDWTDLAESMGEKVCDAVKQQLWTSRVIKVIGDRVFISSGVNAGISEGDVLMVHQQGQLIEGVGGHRFLLHGEKINEIEITAVSDHSAEGIIQSESRVVPGCCVTAKP